MLVSETYTGYFLTKIFLDQIKDSSPLKTALDPALVAPGPDQEVGLLADQEKDVTLGDDRSLPGAPLYNHPCPLLEAQLKQVMEEDRRRKGLGSLKRLPEAVCQGCTLWLKVPAQAQRPRATSRDSPTTTTTLLSSSPPLCLFGSLLSLVAAVEPSFAGVQ